MNKSKDVLVYAQASKWVHWLIALIVIPMLLLSFFIDNLPSAYKPEVIMVHKSLGLTVLVLMILRIFAILFFGKPPLPTSVPKWERVLSKSVQYAFYGLLIAMPLCGWMMSTAANKITRYFDLFSVPFPGISPSKPLAEWLFTCHTTIGYILIGLALLHVAGALKHFWIDKDKVLQRML